jgi:acylglycerol lipase
MLLITSKPERLFMTHIEGRIDGCAGLTIYWQAWRIDAPRAVVVLAHGLGEHSGRYRHVAEALNAVGCSVYAMDHRGHGQSAGPRAYIDRFANVVDDMDQVADLARKACPGKPVLLLGHSMGGALALRYALKHQEKLAGLILSGPAVALDGASALVRSIAKLMALVAPKVGMLQVAPERVSRDAAVVADYASDPLVAHGKVPARTIGELVKFVEVLPGMLPALRLPLLVLHGEQDQLAGVGGSEMVVQRVSSADKTLTVYPELYHEIFNELPDDRARVLKDLTDWVSAHVPA